MVAAGSLESIRQNRSLERGTTTVKKPYHIVGRDEKSAAKSIEAFAKANGQILLPLVELITQARVAVDQVIHTIGRQTIETILMLSAQEVAGVRQPGKPGGDVRWHGSQQGRVMLADRQIKVKRPRLRHKQTGEIPVPAYESLQENGAAAQRMMGALLRGVSTRQYEEVLPEMAGTVGCRAAVSADRRSKAVPSSCGTCNSVAGNRPIFWSSTSMVSALELTMCSAQWASIAKAASIFWESNSAQPKMQPR